MCKIVHQRRKNLGSIATRKVFARPESFCAYNRKIPCQLSQYSWSSGHQPSLPSASWGPPCRHSWSPTAMPWPVWESFEALLCVDVNPGQPAAKPGWEWHLKNYVKMSSERSANISSIISFQLTSLLSRTRPEYIGGYNGQISTSPVYSSTNSPSMRPMTSMGTPARPCFNIFSRAREEM